MQLLDSRMLQRFCRIPLVMYRLLRIFTLFWRLVAPYCAGREKRTIWELGTRVPYMIHVPWMAASHGQHTAGLTEVCPFAHPNRELSCDTIVCAAIVLR